MIIIWISCALLLVVEVNTEEWAKEVEVDLFILVVNRCFYFFFLFGVGGAPSKNLFTLFLEIMLLHLGYCFYMYSSS